MSTQTDPLSTECLWSSSRTQTHHKAIAPHWSLSYTEYLSSDQDQEEQRRVVWSRLHSHQANLASRLSKQKERYLALRQELNPRTTQVESSHRPLFCDRPVLDGQGLTFPQDFASLHPVPRRYPQARGMHVGSRADEGCQCT